MASTLFCPRVNHYPRSARFVKKYLLCTWQIRCLRKKIFNPLEKNNIFTKITGTVISEITILIHSLVPYSSNGEVALTLNLSTLYLHSDFIRSLNNFKHNFIKFYYVWTINVIKYMRKLKYWLTEYSVTH